MVRRRAVIRFCFAAGATLANASGCGLFGKYSFCADLTDACSRCQCDASNAGVNPSQCVNLCPPSDAGATGGAGGSAAASGAAGFGGAGGVGATGGSGPGGAGTAGEMGGIGGVGGTAGTVATGATGGSAGTGGVGATGATGGTSGTGGISSGGGASGTSGTGAVGQAWDSCTDTAQCEQNLLCAALQCRPKCTSNADCGNRPCRMTYDVVTGVATGTRVCTRPDACQVFGSECPSGVACLPYCETGNETTDCFGVGGKLDGASCGHAFACAPGLWCYLSTCQKICTLSSQCSSGVCSFPQTVCQIGGLGWCLP